MREAVAMLLENNPYPQDTRVRNEAETLAEAGFEVTVIAPRAPGQHARELLNGVQVRRFHIRWARRSVSSYVIEYAVAHAQLIVRALLELVRGARIIHFHGPPDTLFLAGVCARLAGRSAIFDLHDAAPELFTAKFGHASTGTAILRAAQRCAIRTSTRVIVTNRSQLELVQRTGATTAVVVRNGPRLQDFEEPALGRAGRLQAPRLVYVGALDLQDGVLELDGLLTAPGLLQATLTVVGDGPLLEELQARCARAGVRERVSFVGRVPHDAVVGLIARADIGVDPAPGSALNHGSTMIKVLEYMAAARPLVAYDLRETRRSAGDAALYAPCGDPARFASLVTQLAGDGPRRVAMALAGRRRAIALSWENSAEALRHLYGELESCESRTSNQRKRERVRDARQPAPPPPINA
jgi:glycosyltransferase involved in cell wall biosynthesis